MTLAANAWMDYVERACGSLYPNLRPGYDFTWGRRPLPTPANPDDPPVPLGDPEMLYWSDKLAAVDMPAIQAKAQEYAESDPHARQEPEDAGNGGGGGAGTVPQAPTVTPVASLTAPVTAGTKVADLAQPGGDTATGPFTYAVVTGAGDVSVSGNELQAAVELSTTTSVGVTSTNTAGTSPEGTASITIV